MGGNLLLSLDFALVFNHASVLLKMSLLLLERFAISFIAFHF